MKTDGNNTDSVSKITLILSIFATLFITVGALELTGKINHNIQKGDVALSTYRVIFIPTDETYRLSRKSSQQTGVCINNYLFIKSDTDTTLQGILVDYKNRGVRCSSKKF